MSQVIRYEIGGLPRPSNDLWQRCILKIYAMPLIHKLGIIKKILHKAFRIPASVAIQPGFYCSAPNIEVGECTGLGNTYILAMAKVKIGHHCSFSFNNMILTTSHDFKDFSTVIAKPVVIGDNVWITSNVTIMGGVAIGSNTVIGAGSVVTRDIPSGVLAAGNPCKVIKKIDFRIEGIG